MGARVDDVGKLVIAGVLGACSFGQTVADVNGTLDAGAGAEMMTGGEESASIAPCQTPDPTGLVVCLEFEDKVDDGTLDDSSPARRTVTSMGLAQLSSTMPMGGTTNVVDVGTAARTYVAQDAALDLA